MKMFKICIFSGILSLATLFSPSLSHAASIEFQAVDVVIPAPSTEVISISMDVNIEVFDGPIDVAVLGMLFNVAPSIDDVTLIDITPSDNGLGNDFQQLTFDFTAVSTVADGVVNAAFLSGDEVHVNSGLYGLFKLNMEIAPNTIGTYDLVFDTNPDFNGVLNISGFHYPLNNPNNSTLGQITVIPEPSSIALLLIGGVGLVWRFRNRVVQIAV